MINGIVATSLNPSLRYAPAINEACMRPYGSQSPLLCYAIAWRESISGEIAGLWESAADVISSDGGHGLFQLTASWPFNWDSAYVNACYAIDDYINPAETFWAEKEQGDKLVLCMAAEFNAGRTLALKGYDLGDVGRFTTDNYAAAVLGFYQNLVTHGSPT